MATHALLLISLFSTDTATTEIYTLSLHDALPISAHRVEREGVSAADHPPQDRRARRSDRKSTRLNSSHMSISYAVFCLKKKTKSTRASRGTRCGAHILEKVPCTFSHHFRQSELQL